MDYPEQYARPYVQGFIRMVEYVSNFVAFLPQVVSALLGLYPISFVTAGVRR
jgi:hypothetical protein